MKAVGEPGTPAALRRINDRAAISALIDHGPLSRTELVERLRLSAPTVAEVVRRLERALLVEVVGKVSRGRGPHTALYQVVADRMVGVAIHWGTDEISANLVDAVGRIRGSIRRCPSSDTVDVPRVIEKTVDQLCADGAYRRSFVTDICVGLPASVSGGVLTFRAVPGWSTNRAAEMISARLGADVCLENDVNLAAVAQRACIGAIPKGFALLWLGAGVGLAVDVGGTLLRGHRGAAGEVGLLRVPDPARPGFVGYLDDLLGWSELQRAAITAHLPAENPSKLAGSLRAADQTMLGDGSNLTHFAETLAPAVAEALKPVLAVLDPETVFLGGPVGSAAGAALSEAVEQRILADRSWTVSVRPAHDINDPVLRGARDHIAHALQSRLLAAV